MSLLYLRNGVVGQLLRSKCIFLLFWKVCCSPPEDPIKCTSSNTNCTITNSIGAFPDRTVCRALNVVYPTTEEELFSIVASATMKGSKIKVATRYSHSIPKLICPSGEDGLLISTKYLNGVLKIDDEAMTMTVEAGVTLKELIHEAANAGLAMPYAPYWWGLTIGGLLSTGAHGSTLWGKGSSVHDYVTALKIVSPGGPEDGYVKVRVFNDGDEELDAARVSLGILGVISQVTLRLKPLFKRSITYLTKTDSDLGDEAASFGKKHEFADITWYPSQHKAVYRVDDRVPINTSGNGLYDFTPFRSTPSLTLAVIRTTEENQESESDDDGKCIGAKLVTSTLLNTAFGLTNNGVIFTGYPVIGYQHRLQASGSCLEGPEDKRITACAWDPRVKGEFFHQTTFSIGLSSVKSFIQDVQRLVELQPKALCGLELYNGILMRYVTISSAYLGKEEDAVDFDFTYYRSKDPMTPRLYEDVVEEIEQMAVIKYGALPHWGKNRNIVFDGVINKYKNAGKFLAVKKLYDPMGLFSSEWTDQLFGLQSGIAMFKEGCALEGLCICQEDVHCAPVKGYFCTHGKVFEDARVCSRQESLNSKIYAE
ncbi:probable L-gulonolactone oxidase 6 [Ziziphus jujuba]|uniref:L-gulonolactone oxidase n=1 Tax=Ziziphus jujuba TaxID=326968 RepID=A0A6P4AJU6_ZIZJJ|nr:probable L-gulonolactone oxidase 6 [Ziziphus jujuba]